MLTVTGAPWEWHQHFPLCWAEVTVACTDWDLVAARRRQDAPACELDNLQAVALTYRALHKLHGLQQHSKRHSTRAFALTVLIRQHRLSCGMAPAFTQSSLHAGKQLPGPVQSQIRSGRLTLGLRRFTEKAYFFMPVACTRISTCACVRSACLKQLTCRKDPRQVSA